MGRLFHEIVQTTATLESRNNDKQSQQLFLINYSQARNQWIAISSHKDKPEFFISLTNIVLLGKSPLSQYIKLLPLSIQGVV